MRAVEIRHRTVYHYDRPVELGPHRLLLWPRESHEVRIEAQTLELTPPAAVSWAQDVFGNTVATATFAAPTELLTIRSFLRVSLAARPWPVFPVAATAIDFPFAYDGSDRRDLGALLEPDDGDGLAEGEDDGGGRIADWARSFVAGPRTDTLSLLKDLAAGVGALSYHERHDAGYRSPAATLACGAGSCRDFAVLFVDAARRLGFGARLVSGYLFQPELEGVGSTAAGSMHAWAEVYLPGAGWIAFDPTNRSVGGANLVPVAVARSMARAAPVSGSYAGLSEAATRMTVHVDVRAVGPNAGADELPASA